MIAISVTPLRLVAGQRARLDIRFSNTGAGPCRKVVFTLGMPPGLRLVSGEERIDIPVIWPGVHTVRSVTVEPAGAGDYVLTSPNFSYRDEDDQPVRDRDWRAVLVVAGPDFVPGPVPVSVLIPAPELKVEREGTGMLADEWAQLPILVRNPSGVTVSDVSVEITSSIEINPRRGRIAALPGGKAARLRFDARSHDVGLVPFTVCLTYSYADGSGLSRRMSWNEQLHVPVTRDRDAARPATVSSTSSTADADSTRPRERVQTVLFLAANPRNLEKLRPDEELRLIERELWLSPDRDEFRLASQVAVQLPDINRALYRYKPQIVHFSGHGDETGRIYVEDELGYSRPVEPVGLAKLFKAHSETIRCVLVNACHSQRLAMAVVRDTSETASDGIEHAIGMRYPIGDTAAVRFSLGFYQAIFGGATVPQAFKTAPALLESDAETMAAYEVPQLYSRMTG
jgi:hypothetical protein